MSVTLDDAIDHLNLRNTGEEDGELERFVDAANEWVSARVTGLAELPADSIQELAALFLIDHWWATQRGPASSSIEGGEYSDVTIDGRGYAIPNRVRELLGPYLGAAFAGVAGPQGAGSFPDARAWPDPVEWC